MARLRVLPVPVVPVLTVPPRGRHIPGVGGGMHLATHLSRLPTSHTVNRAKGIYLCLWIVDNTLDGSARARGSSRCIRANRYPSSSGGSSSNLRPRTPGDTLVVARGAAVAVVDICRLHRRWGIGGGGGGSGGG